MADASLQRGESSTTRRGRPAVTSFDLFILSQRRPHRVATSAAIGVFVPLVAATLAGRPEWSPYARRASVVATMQATAVPDS
jgi:hypothetical protein